MEVPSEHPAEENKRLRRSINDLISVLALPAIWSGGEPCQIVRILLDVLPDMLRLDLIYVRLEDEAGAAPVEMIPVAQSQDLKIGPREMGELLNHKFGDDSKGWPPIFPMRIGGIDLAFAPLQMGLNGGLGVIVAGSRRLDFPGPTEKLLLNVAVNQAVIGLQGARLLSQQKRVAAELDQRVAQRTSELASANEELKRNEGYLRNSAKIAQCLMAVRADVSAALSKPIQAGEMLQECAQAMVRHLDAAFARIWTLNPGEDVLQLRASAGCYTRLDGTHHRIKFGQLKVGLIAQERKLYLTNDVLNDPRIGDKEWARSCGFVSFAGYPLVVDRRTVGVMAMFARHALSGAAVDGLVSVADAIAQGLQRKRNEDELRKAQANLSHVARLTTAGELTASIAHEVNQPLASIVNNANACLSLLAHDAPPLNEIREALLEIVQGTDQAGAVIARVRQLVRKAPSERTILNLTDVVGEVLILARHELAARQVSVATELAGDLPPVNGDRVQLQQVLLNLIVNGMDAMNAIEQSKRALAICGRREMRDGEARCLLSVQDAGVGFKPGEIGRLFEAFYTTKPEGMGMGLAISRSIIDAHGGLLWAESNQEAGATFLFSLPAAGNSNS